MKSKYPLHPDFANVEDSGKTNESRLMMDIANFIIRRQVKKFPVDTAKICEKFYYIPGYEGKKFRLCVYSPADARPEEPLPCIINIHGGGFWGTVLPHQKNYSLYFAEHLRCRVIMPEYHLALRHPFPAPAEDCYAALLWAAKNAQDLGINPDKHAVFGDSAGGTLATAMCIMSRDRNGPKICYQMLIYPGVDSTGSTESAKTFTDTPQINCHGLAQSWRYYLKNGDCGMPGYASPLWADTLSGLPPAYVEAAEFDPLHDEDILYAQKLRQFGVPVELNDTKGSFHGFDMQMDAPYSRRMMEHRCEIFNHVLNG